MATTTQTVVGVYDPTSLQPVWPNAQYMAASVTEGGRLMRHPLEDGSQTTDHVVYDLTEIALPVILTGDIKSQVDAFRQAFRAGTLFNVQTKAGVYLSMVLSEFPHEENPEAIDAATVKLKFCEARFVSSQQGGKVPRHPQHKSATKRGQVQAATPSTTPQGSWLYRNFGGLFK